jgi:hypothetical protein
MYCIQCGTLNSETVRYCTRCGSNLADVLGEGETQPVLSNRAAGLVLVFAPAVALLVMLAVFIIGGLILSDNAGKADFEKIAVFVTMLGLGTLSAICFVLWHLMQFLNRNRAGVSRQKQRYLAPAEPRESLTPAREPVSVVEHTTSRLPEHLRGATRNTH